MTPGTDNAYIKKDIVTNAYLVNQPEGEKQTNVKDNFSKKK